MSRVVLELNDQALRLYSDGGLQLSSPGYVTVIGNNAQFGQQAAEQSRLHPTHTNNEFWHRLSMEPLARPLAHYRHYADIAHAHLMNVAEQSDYHGPVILAVPGSYNRQQLAVLSGVLQHSPFQPQALVDASLLAALSQVPGASKLVYIDVQLHQLTLTLLHREDGQWVRGALQSVQSAGWHNLSNALVQVINDAFIAQCRFNPQHNASWEQHLYNELPHVLTRIKAGEQSVPVVIDTGQTRHEARIGRDDLTAELESVYRKTAHQLQTLAAEASVAVLLSERAALIPGLMEWLGVADAPVSSEQMAQAGLQLNIESAVDTGQVPYLTRLAALGQGRQERAMEPRRRPSAGQMPTHLLLGHQARRVQDGMAVVVTSAGPRLQAAQESDSVCRIQRTADQVILHPAAGAAISLNGRPLTQPTATYAGDALSFGADSEVAQLIQVVAE